MVLTEGIVRVEFVDEREPRTGGQTSTVPVALQQLHLDLGGADVLQNADAKDENEANPLLRRDFKREDHGQRHQEDDDIGHDAENGIGKEGRGHPHATARPVPVPEVPDRFALGDDGYVDSDGKHDAEGRDEIDDPPEALARVDAVIEGEDAELVGECGRVPQDYEDV